MMTVRNPGAPSRALWLDRLGMGGSLLCATHCLVCSVAPALLTSLSLGSLASHDFEWLLTGCAVGLALLSAVHGFRHLHSRVLLVGFVASVLGLVGARALEETGAGEAALPVAVASGLGMAALHLLSLGKRRACLECNRPRT